MAFNTIPLNLIKRLYQAQSTAAGFMLNRFSTETDVIIKSNKENVILIEAAIKASMFS